jgi:hypothetical protein
MLRQSVATGLTLLLLAALPAAVSADSTKIEVYKSPTCGCCGKWVDHLRQNGFSVKTIDVPDVTPIKRDHGVPVQLSSCHTAIVDGYVIEGHVPAQDVKRLLVERPAVSGLAVPRMPIGSPGMEGPNPEPYSVLSFDRSGKIEVFSTHSPDQ